MNQFAATGIDPDAVDAEELAKLIEARDSIPRQAFTRRSRRAATRLLGREYLGDGQISDTSELEPIVEQDPRREPGPGRGLPRRQGRACSASSSAR
jgi:hypothetical protein